MNLNFICSFIWSSFQNNYYQTSQSNVNTWRTHHKLIPSEGRPYFYKPGSRKTCIARNEGLITIILWNPIFSSHSILIVFRLTLSTRCRVQRFSSPWDLILQLVAHWYLAIELTQDDNGLKILQAKLRRRSLPFTKGFWHYKSDHVLQ